MADSSRAGPEREPIAVGGGYVFGWWNSRVYLDTLLTYDQRPLKFNRQGSFTGMSGHPTDIWSVEVDGQPYDSILLDIYSLAQDLQSPPGYRFKSEQHLPLDLPRSLVIWPYDSREEETVAFEPRLWRIEDDHEQVLGFVQWDGRRGIESDLGPNLQKLVTDKLTFFVDRTRTTDLPSVLDDFFARYLPIDSGGLVTAKATSPYDHKDHPGGVWSETTSEPRQEKGRVKRSLKGWLRK